MVYFIFTSLSIVGYNSQTITDEAQIFLLVFLAVAFSFIPQIANEIMDIVGAKSPYALARYDKINEGTPHIVIIGEISASNLRNLLDEYFHKDHCD